MQHMIIRAIAVFQIYGGITGLIGILSSLANVKENAQFMIGIALYVYSILCGYLLIQGVKYRIVWSQINQFLQMLFFFMIGAGAFQYISGGYWAFGVEGTSEMKFHFVFGLVSEFEFIINESYPRNGVYLNITALLILYLLSRYSDEEEKDLFDFILENQRDIDLSD